MWLLNLLLGNGRAGKAFYLLLFLLAGPALVWWFVFRPSALFTDADEQLFRAARHGDRRGIALALDQGATVDARGPVDGKTALFRAAVFGHADVVADLLSRGADATARGADGKTALEVVIDARAGEHDAGRARDLEAVEALLRAKAARP